MNPLQALTLWKTVQYLDLMKINGNHPLTNTEIKSILMISYMVIVIFLLLHYTKNPIYVIKDENNETVHYYCKDTIKNKTIYIDVRGITNDLDAFASEFEDWVDKQDISTHSTLVNTQDIEREIQKENGNEILITAFYIIDDQPNGYNTNFL